MSTQILTTSPRSARNFNPGNIRYGLPWEGLGSPPVDGDGFCRFVSAPWGFRAMCRSYMTKFDREGIDTIRKLITQWSPPNGDGNSAASTNAYIAAVSKSSGYDADEKLPMKTWECCKRIAYAQAAFEAGAPFETYWKLSDLAEGAYRAGITDAPPPVAKQIASTIASSAGGIAAATGVVQTAVETASASPHSPKITIALLAAAAILAFLGAILRSRAHVEHDT